MIVGADIFLGLSGPGAMKQEWVKTMGAKPIVFALANPTPEILPEEVKAVRPEAIIATGRSDYPNQVNNVLCFPFIFRGALDVGATKINEEMKLACVHAIAELAQAEQSDVVAMAYEGEDLSFGPGVHHPQALRPAAHHPHRAGGGEGGDGERGRHASHRRPGRLPRATHQLRLPVRFHHEAGVRRGEKVAPSA